MLYFSLIHGIRNSTQIRNERNFSEAFCPRIGERTTSSRRQKCETNWERSRKGCRVENVDYFCRHGYYHAPVSRPIDRPLTSKPSREGREGLGTRVTRVHFCDQVYPGKWQRAASPSAWGCYFAYIQVAFHTSELGCYGGGREGGKSMN